jgi:cysteine desulfurase
VGWSKRTTQYGQHIITSSIEHSCVKSVCEDLEKQGYSITYLPVYDDGLVRVEDVAAAIKEDTVLVSIMTANMRSARSSRFEEIGKLVRNLRQDGKKIWFHTDAVQAAGKVPVDVEEIGCDLLSISAHKIYARKASALSTSGAELVFILRTSVAARNEAFAEAPNLFR